ncbi:hypothetical protein V6N11_043925 [Hibiscus sabdariffa]|uniref:Uncharacterized protein n=1 Tax=Hibiscus sabdariffa TaxID=183260 RepID=A0ABR2RDP2_9ROSI
MTCVLSVEKWHWNWTFLLSWIQGDRITSGRMILKLGVRFKEVPVPDNLVSVLQARDLALEVAEYRY